MWSSKGWGPSIRFNRIIEEIPHSNEVISPVISPPTRAVSLSLSLSLSLLLSLLRHIKISTFRFGTTSFTSLHRGSNSPNCVYEIHDHTGFLRQAVQLDRLICIFGLSCQPRSLVTTNYSSQGTAVGLTFPLGCSTSTVRAPMVTVLASKLT